MHKPGAGAGVVDMVVGVTELEVEATGGSIHIVKRGILDGKQRFSCRSCYKWWGRSGTELVGDFLKKISQGDRGLMQWPEVEQLNPRTVEAIHRLRLIKGAELR